MGFYWAGATAGAVALDRFWLRGMNSYVACSIMHLVLIGIVAGHLAVTAGDEVDRMPVWLMVCAPFACAFFVLGCLSLARRQQP